MNAAPLYRPQLGVGGGTGGQPNQLGGLQNGNGPINERDDRGRNQGGGYIEANSPLSPSAGSDFSFSRYNSNDTYAPQRNLGYNNEPPIPNSGSNNSLMSQRSSGSNATPRDSVVIEHYAALKKYLTRHLAAEGIPTRIAESC
jgi:hypothetical protein